RTRLARGSCAVRCVIRRGRSLALFVCPSWVIVHVYLTLAAKVAAVACVARTGTACNRPSLTLVVTTQPAKARDALLVRRPGDEEQIRRGGPGYDYDRSQSTSGRVPPARRPRKSRTRSWDSLSYRAGALVGFAPHIP